MSSAFTQYRRRTAMLPAMGFGLMMGLLMTGIGEPIKAPGVTEPLAAKSGSPGTRAPIRAWFPTPGCSDRDSDQSQSRRSRPITPVQASLLGLRNVRRLLPLAKRLTIEALGKTGPRYGVPAPQIQRAEHRIASANRVLLDKGLGDAAMVDDRCPSIVRIGPLCAAALVSDDAAVFILGHELVHIGNSRGDLKVLASLVSQGARSIACVTATDSQAEDLACDFIAELVLRNFVSGRPTTRSLEERLCLTLAAGNPGDRAHLSDAQTLRALIGLDPQLRLLLMRWLGGSHMDDYTNAEPSATE